MAPAATGPDTAEKVRLAVYNGFARTGRAPSGPELAALTELAPADVRRALHALHASHDVFLDPRDNDQVVMAHPFASVPLGFSVMGARTLWWGGCACDTPHAWVVGRDQPPEGGQVAHFLTPMQRAWDDIVRTCGNQRLFCSASCVDAWLEQTGQERGYTMDLSTLWRLASDWYAGRLDQGYSRRDPASASAYFAHVGLHGSFWGLPD